MKIRGQATTEELLQNKNYAKYFAQRERIRKKYHTRLLSAVAYPNQDKEWVKYKKEIMDLMMKPKGYYQKFIWDTEQAQIDQEDAYKMRREEAKKKKRKTLTKL